MDNKLAIIQEKTGDGVLLKLTGRLDANNAAYLDDKLSELIQEGNYIVALDTEGIAFLSSAGIRILVKQSKAFKNISGGLSISKFSEGVKTVLDMVGMSGMFISKGIVKITKEDKESKDIERYGYSFVKSERQSIPAAKLKIIGDPEKIKNSSFSGIDNRKIKIQESFFGIGIGAFGENFDDCKNQYGESIALGEAIATLPSDNTKTPDYMIRTGNLVPEINALYFIGVNDSFQYEINLKPETESSITLGKITETVSETGNHKTFAMLLIAESSGLVGASIKNSPINGINLFSFPEVRDNVKFTTEPAHMRGMTVTFGVYSKNPEKELKKYLKPLDKTGKLFGHTHSAVFSYTPLQKEKLDYTTAIRYLFEESDILDVIHLLNDDREINGIGDSSFKSGHIWVSEIAI